MTIYFDANISQYYARAFAIIEQSEKRGINVVSTVDEFGDDKPDEEIIPLIGQESGIFLITKDTDFRKIQVHMELMKQHNLGVIHFHHPKAINKWLELRWLITAWPEIRDHALKNHKPPYLYEFRTDGKLKRLTLQ